MSARKTRAAKATEVLAFAQGWYPPGTRVEHKNVRGKFGRVVTVGRMTGNWSGYWQYTIDWEPGGPKPWTGVHGYYVSDVIIRAEEE